MTQFWKQVWAQAAAGLILAAAGGIGYLVYSVPRQLDQVVNNQRIMLERFGAVERRLDKAEGAIEGLNTRVSHLERP